MLGPPVPLFAAGTRIGVIGAGRIGSAVGELWAKAGHPVMFSSLDLAQDKALAARVGHGARAGTSKEAAAFGEVLFFAVPYAAMPTLGRELGGSIKGKVVLDASNPVPGRDGEMAVAALAKSSGVATSEYLPGARIVRAFNIIGFAQIRSEAHRTGEKLAVVLVADDPAAMKVAMRLVNDAGFDAVPVGGLARSKEFDYGSPLFGKLMTAAQARAIFGVK